MRAAMRKILRIGEKEKPQLEPEERQVSSDLRTGVEMLQALIPFLIYG
jgi:hypothetical protein